MDRDLLHRWAIIALFCCGTAMVIAAALLIWYPSLLPAGSSLPGASPVSVPSGETGSGTARNAGIPAQAGPALAGSPGLVIVTTDISSGAPIPGVSLFVNGLLAGTTSQNGTFFLPVTGTGSNIGTIRAVKEGYLDRTVGADLDTPGMVPISLSRSPLIPLEINGPPQSEITIVFLPSDTSFNATENKKILLGGYPGGEAQFEADVRTFIANTFMKYPAVTSPAHPLPADYGKRFNFYYYWDGKTYADAFDGCAGTIPPAYWDAVTDSDLTIILYPSYSGLYLGSSGQPVGCTNPNGPGRVYLKIPADATFLGMHEIGHGLYGLMDTYCGDTYYAQNEPDPNVWSSLESCRKDALANNWDPAACRQISSSGCTREFWHIDADPDIMHDGYDGSFGNASTKKIIYVLNTIIPKHS